MLLLCPYFNNLVRITFSKILENYVRRDTGIQLDTSVLFPFLYKVFIIENFNPSGKTPLKELYYIYNLGVSL